MDIIQDQWSPCHNICTILTSIQSLLTDPNCASPANPEAANLYTNDRQAYNRYVRVLRTASLFGRVQMRCELRPGCTVDARSYCLNTASVDACCWYIAHDERTFCDAIQCCSFCLRPT